MIRQLARSEEGITLTELLVAMVVATIVTAASIAWVGAVLRSDRNNQQTIETIDELRFAKTQLVRELRFAEEIYPPGAGDDSISFYIDLDGSGESAPIPGEGEVITYEITAGGIFERSTDDPADPVVTIAEGLVAVDSSMVVSGTSVDIVLAIDLDTSDSLPAHTIHTTIAARNA